MTIKKQFIFLSLSIISIPLTVLILIVFHYHFYNQRANQYIKDINKIETISISQKDLDFIKKTIQVLPSDFQMVFFTTDESIIYNTIPELNGHNKLGQNLLWEIVNNTEKDFFYTSLSISAGEEKGVLLIRIPHNSEGISNKANLYFKLQFYIFSLISLLIMLVIIIFRSIFKSIMIITKSTEKIANGDLSEKIDISATTSGNEIISISKNLEKMRLSLKEAQDRRNKFIMGISHDLRTPISVIRGYTEAISDGVITEPEEINKALKLIKKESTNLEELINTLINYTKLNGLDIRNQMSEGSITDFISNFAKYGSTVGPVFKRIIKTDIKHTKNIFIHFNEQMIYRAFENLLTNAIRYTDDGDMITITSYNDDKNVYVKFSDTGIGISPEHLKSIFVLFFRASPSRKEQGFGVGLSVVKSIIDTHGWLINVESKVDFGTTFTITIPYIETETETEKEILTKENNQEL